VAQEHPLLTEYKKTISSKIENLESLIQNLKQKKNLESLNFLRAEIHKLTGNSGSYGFLKVSELCKFMDLDLQIKIKNFSPTLLTDAWFEELDLFIIQVKKAFLKADRPLEF
jgi:HPt (histidine-containing phosphotransfer) domain-containing protein